MWMPVMWVGLLALGGCQQAMRSPDAATGEAPEASASRPAAVALPADPPCPDGLTAVLSSGVVVGFVGSTDDDPDTCVQQWNGRSYRYYLGFWGNGRFGHGTSEQRQALQDVLRGPVGVTRTVALSGPATGELWRSATVTHEADTSLPVGRHSRPAVKLRVVRQDALGRSSVTAESLCWLDRATGIPLKKETVTRMADGHVSRITTWNVSAVQRANTEAAAPGTGASNVD